MSYTGSILTLGERVTLRARVHPLAYIWPILILVALMNPGPLTRLLTTELSLTNTRLIGKLGTLRRKDLAWPHAKVSLLRVDQSPLGRLFDYGTVTAINTDGTRIKFKGINAPYLLQQETEEATERAILGRTLKEEGVMGSF